MKNTVSVFPRAHCDPRYLPNDCARRLRWHRIGFGAARYVELLFYQVKATDMDMIALPPCAILVTALVATLPAVLRALRTDPTEILRGVSNRVLLIVKFADDDRFFPCIGFI